MLARLAAGPARAGRSGGAGLPRARRQRRRWPALGCRTDQKWPVHAPEADALATRAPLRGAAGRQDAGEDAGARPARAAGGLALELAPPGPNAGRPARAA